MSYCDLDLWSVDLDVLQHFGCHAFKLCTKFERNRIIHRWVIYDLALFRRAQRFSGVRGPNFTKLGENIGRSWLHKKFVSAFGDLVAFSNADGSKLSDVENDAKFRTLWPPLWKLGEEWAISLYQWLKLYLRPNLRNTFDGHQLRWCWTRCIDKKRKEKKEKKNIHG